jgi:hypothetical protein
MRTLSETAIADYRFPAEENKHPVSFCSKQTEGCCFPLVPFALYIYLYVDIKTGAFNRYIYKRKTELYIYICCRFKEKTENGSPGHFP